MHFVESVLACLSGQQGVVAMPAKPPDGRKVKSGPAGAGEVRTLVGRAGGRDLFMLSRVFGLN